MKLHITSICQHRIIIESDTECKQYIKGYKQNGSFEINFISIAHWGRQGQTQSVKVKAGCLLFL